MQINLMAQIELNEVQTTASLMKIKPPGEVHKNIVTKKGPASIRQQSMSLFSSPSPRQKASPASLSPSAFLNQDLPLTQHSHSAEPPHEDVKRLPFEFKTHMIQEIAELISHDTHSQQAATKLEKED